jgi:hypothetical protein
LDREGRKEERSQNSILSIIHLEFDDQGVEGNHNNTTTYTTKNKNITSAVVI